MGSHPRLWLQRLVENRLPSRLRHLGGARARDTECKYPQPRRIQKHLHKLKQPSRPVSPRKRAPVARREAKRLRTATTAMRARMAEYSSAATTALGHSTWRSVCNDIARSTVFLTRSQAKMMILSGTVLAASPSSTSAAKRTRRSAREFSPKSRQLPIARKRLTSNSNRSGRSLSVKESKSASKRKKKSKRDRGLGTRS